MITVIIYICIFCVFAVTFAKFLMLMKKGALLLQLFALGITLLGAFILYITNKHQHFIRQPLAKRWRIISYLCCLVALVIWLQLFAVSAAIFIWFFTAISALIVIPLIALIKPQGSIK